MNLINTIKRKLYIGYLKFIKYPFLGYYNKKLAGLTNIDILPENAKYFLGMVAIFKGEDDYLIEWIEFHKIMGVEHFILYDNGLEQSSKTLLDPYIKSGLVTHIPFPDVPNVKYGKYADNFTTQQLAYGDCIKKFRNSFKYLIRLDIDEFLFPKKHDTIVKVLKQFNYKKIKGIEVAWLNFGNSGHMSKPEGLVIENFTMCGKNIVRDTVKSICNTSFLSNYLKYTDVHHFSYRISITDLFKRIFTGYPKLIVNKKANQLFQLNHYRTKSKEEYLKKGVINTGGYLTGKISEEKFNIYNSQNNKIENCNIHRFLPKLKEALKEV